MFVLVTFILLLSALGLVSATDVSSNNSSTTLSTDSVVSDGASYVEKQTNYDNDSNDFNKLNSNYSFENNLTSKKINKSVVDNKLGDSSVNVGSFADLKNALTTANTGTYGVYTITLTNNIVSTEVFMWSRESSSTSLVINGNGKTITGSGNHRFMNITINTNVSIINTVFTNFHYTNSQGGVFYNQGNLTINNCTFTYCNATNRGGVIYSNGILNIDDSNFTHCNSSDDGGVLNTGGGHTNITNTVFNSCQSTGTSSGSSSSVMEGVYYNCTNCTFINNTVYSSADSSLAWVSATNFTNCVFINNTSPNGPHACIYNYGASSVTGCVFDGNTNKTGPNDIWRAANIVVSNNTFTSNSSIYGAYTNGGGNEVDNKLFYVSTFAELQSAISSASSLTGNVTIVLNNNITSTAQLLWTRNSSSTNLTIKGKGFTITSGGGTYRFLNSTIDTGITIYDCYFQNFKTNYYGGCIFTAGNLTLENCNFTNCNSSPTSGDGNSGGAIYSTGNLTVVNCGFYKCNSLTGSGDGGAIQTHTSNLTVIGSDFVNCRTASDGGAISSWYSINNIINNTFINCSTGSGWGVLSQHGGGNGNVSGNIFVNCTPYSVKIGSGSMDIINNTVSGGGIISGGTQENNTIQSKVFYVSSFTELQSAITNATALTGNVTIVLTNNITSTAVILWNRTCNYTNLTINGDGFTVTGSGTHRFMNITVGTNITVENCTFTKFCYTVTGSVFYNQGNFTVRNCNFSYDYLTSATGGAVWSNSKDALLDNCIFSHCNCTDNGGAVYFQNGNLTNCIFEYNTLTYRGGSATALEGQYMNVVNCSFFNNSCNVTQTDASVVWCTWSNFTNCSFVNNYITTASTYTSNADGALILNSGTCIVSGCYFENNYCTNGVNDLWVGSNSSNLTNNTLNESNIRGNYTDGGGNTIISPIIVSSWAQLVSAIANASTTTSRSIYSIYLNSSAVFNATTVLNFATSRSVTNLFIYGNGSVLNGRNTYSFLRAGSGLNVHVQDLKLANFTNATGSLAFSNGSLSLVNVSVNNSSSVGCVFGSGGGLSLSGVGGNVSVRVDNVGNLSSVLCEAKNFTGGVYSVGVNFYLVGVGSEFVWGGSVEKNKYFITYFYFIYSTEIGICFLLMKKNNISFIYGLGIYLYLVLCVVIMYFNHEVL